MYLLQGFYALLLNPIYKITGKIDERVRNAIITLCCIFLTGFFIAYYDAANRLGIYLKHTKNSMLCGLVLVILVICSIKAPLKKVEWDRVLFYLFFIAGLGIVAISFLHPIGRGYRPFGMMMMVGFPCMYFVWNNRGDYDVLYKRLSFATCFVGLLFFAYCLKLAANGELLIADGRVCAFFRNANMFSMVGMVMVCASVYMFMVNRKSLIWFIYSVASFAVGWEIVLLGVSRLSILVDAGSVAALVIYGIKTRSAIITEQGRTATYLRSLAILVVLVLTVTAGSFVLKMNSNAIMEKALAESAATEQQAGDAAAAPAEIPAPVEVPADDQASATNRFDVSGLDANGYTAGRLRIWQGYAQHLNMLGNNYKKADIHAITGSRAVHAHNNFLELAFRCGIPVACLHILLELYAGIVCIIFLFGKKYREPYYLFTIVFMICYAVESMFDIATLPFERQAPFFFYMALIPLFGRKTNVPEVPDRYETPRHMRKDK